MTTTTFETAKIGDKVFSPTFGWGEIFYIHSISNYPINVRFYNNGEVQCFTFEGYFYKGAPIQSLFWNEIDIEAPIKPVSARIVNGIEIPNISFNPNSGDNCYIPLPTHPDLYLHIYYCFNETNRHLSANGLCYPFTEEGKQAAILHAKAMLGVL